MAENTILIVEDDPNSAFVLEKILKQAGYSILQVATSGRMAIDLVEKHHPTLILMDVTLPDDTDGIKVTTIIHKKYDIPVIYLTGHSSEEIVQRAKATTPFGFLLKPYSAKMVLVSVEMALYKAAIEREAKEAKLRLAVTLGNLPNPVFALGAEGNVNYANTAALQLLGMPVLDVLNHPLDQLLPLKEPYKNNHVYFLEYLSGESFKTGNTHVVFTKKTGEERHLYIKVNSLQNLYKEVQGYVVSLDDFTEQFYAEQRNQTLALALSNFQEGVIVAEHEKTKNDFIISYVNQGFLSCLHTQEEHWLGHGLLAKVKGKINLNIERAIREFCVYTADTEIQTENNLKTITHWTLSPYIDPERDVRSIIVTIQDITQLRKIEENLRQTQKIEAVGRLASGIAHDFNNLLSVVNGCSDLALQCTEDKEKVKNYLLSISEAGRRGGMLVQQLMLFCRKENLNKQGSAAIQAPTELSAIKTLQMIQNYLGDNVDFKFTVEKHLWDISVSEVHMNQILVNLCVNAQDAIPENGVIRVSLSNYEGCPPGLLKNRYVKISVSDNGMGISEETQKKIFEPFFTTKSVGKGTGLGLSVVYGLIQHYEGTVVVQSEINKGTTFTLYFPVHQNSEDFIEKEKLSDKKIGKYCCLSLNNPIEHLLRPLLVKNKWEICQTNEIEKLRASKQRVVTISHEKTSDIYVPRAFCKDSPVQHPYAISQILAELKRLA